ncbi:MAG: DUF411 domain-containing protein [Pseudomonadota bacterium]|nr:DUF411 domain-containing protein [Pseudomonadota bacterium]
MQRRTTLLIALAVAVPQFPAFAANLHVRLYRNPNCYCCDLYAKHLEENGFDVALIDTTDMAAIKQKFGVPEKLEGCHTATVLGYVIEGLIPAQFIHKMVKEQPNIKGLSVPGMPTGAPGMPGAKSAPLKVYVMEASASPRVFATF